MGIELSRDRIEDYANPFELGLSIDGENASIGVRIRRDEPRCEQYFNLGWDCGRLYCSASMWFKDAEFAQKVHGAMTKSGSKGLGLDDKREVYVCKYMETGEIEHLTLRMEDVVEEWIASWKKIGGLKRFHAKTASISR